MRWPFEAKQFHRVRKRFGRTTILVKFEGGKDPSSAYSQIHCLLVYVWFIFRNFVHKNIMIGEEPTNLNIRWRKGAFDT